ncbi:hypothetical protein ACEQ8H_001645 [Pleosporales sp. CAS-2024a]
MATLAHCAFCFETLAANLEKRPQLSLSKVECLWSKHASASSSAASSSSTSISSVDTTSPLFVTWNTVSQSGEKRLRGCIGTFEAQELETGLRDYALTSALSDHRFSPMTLSELPTLSVGVTLLTDFEPASHALDWRLGTHGIRVAFEHEGRRYGATYLPDVATEQGWSKEEAVVSAMRKAGWRGREDEWESVGVRVTRYQGKKVELDYGEWARWRRVVDGEEEEEEEDEE